MKKNNLLSPDPEWNTIFHSVLLHAPKMAADCSREEYEKRMEMRILGALSANSSRKHPLQCPNPVFIFRKMKTAFMAIYDIGASLAPSLPETEQLSQTPKTLSHE